MEYPIRKNLHDFLSEYIDVNTTYTLSDGIMDEECIRQSIILMLTHELVTMKKLAEVMNSGNVYVPVEKLRRFIVCGKWRVFEPAFKEGKANLIVAE